MNVGDLALWTGIHIWKNGGPSRTCLLIQKNEDIFTILIKGKLKKVSSLDVVDFNMNSCNSFFSCDRL